MIRKKLLKITLITTIAATLLVSAGCGKKAADNNTIQAEDTTGSIVEFKGNIITDEKGEVTVKDVVAKSDNPFVKEDGTDVVADADNTVTDESGNEGNNEVMKTETPNDSNEEEAPSEPEYTPSEPTPEPEPEAPAESEPSVEPEQPAEPEPEPTPEPTPAPSMTDEERLVATGHWVSDGLGVTYFPSGACTGYDYTDPITGKWLGVTFTNGKYDGLSMHDPDDYVAICKAHGIDPSTPHKEVIYML